MNEPVRVYDTSGPWGDNAVRSTVDVAKGLSPLRAKWIRDRGDVEEIRGAKCNRSTTVMFPRNTLLTDYVRLGPRMEMAARHSIAPNEKSIRAKNGAVTQLAYARRGIITPEMEFIAIRENHGREKRCSGGL